MRRASLLVVLASVVLAVAWGFGRLDAPDAEGPRVARSPAARRSPGPSPAPIPTAVAGARSDDGVPLRDLFAYSDDDVAPRPTVVVLETPPATPVPTPEPPPLRLVGFVRRGDDLRAALSTGGQVTVAAAGESAGDVRVLAIDEDRGVHLRLANGHEHWLRPER